MRTSSTVAVDGDGDGDGKGAITQGTIYDARPCYAAVGGCLNGKQMLVGKGEGRPAERNVVDETGRTVNTSPK